MRLSLNQNLFDSKLKVKLIVLHYYTILISVKVYLKRLLSINKERGELFRRVIFAQKK